VPNLASVDWMIVLIYLFFVFGVGFSLKPYIASTQDFLLAGRSMPAWLCGFAFLSLTVSSPLVIAVSAAGAQYGLASAQFYLLGAIPPLLFLALFMAPLFYASKARSVPEFLGLRFDAKTRTLNACLFALVALFGAGLSLYAMAWLMQALHIFDVLLHVESLGQTWILLIAIAIPAAVVLVYLLLGGLTAALYTQVMQFFVLIAALFPAVLLGLKQIGGWRGLMAQVPVSTYLQQFAGARGASAPSIALALALGIAFSAAFWCTDFRVLQTIFAAKDAAAARKAPLVAAAGAVLTPLLLILPGVVAIALPTPHNSEVVHNENGNIYHDITVVPEAVQAGRGLIPAQTNASIDPMAGKPLLDANGKPLLDFAIALPIAVTHFLPTGLLGLGLTALLACLMSGVAAGIAAFNTVFTSDLYQGVLHKGASDHQALVVARWACVGGMVLALGVAGAAIRFPHLLEVLALAFAVLNAPQLATLLLGMFWKRATAHGAFAGLVAGVAAAVFHYALTLPAGAHPGFDGGWIAIVHRYPSSFAQDAWTAIFAFTASLVVTVAVSLVTRARPAAELTGLVHSLTAPLPRHSVWWKRPETAAAAILIAAIVVVAVFH
jgi:solute:Na+ symporter, SSS family